MWIMHPGIILKDNDNAIVHTGVDDDNAIVHPGKYNDTAIMHPGLDSDNVPHSISDSKSGTDTQMDTIP